MPSWDQSPPTSGMICPRTSDLAKQASENDCHRCEGEETYLVIVPSISEITNLVMWSKRKIFDSIVVVPCHAVVTLNSTLFLPSFRFSRFNSSEERIIFFLNVLDWCEGVDRCWSFACSIFVVILPTSRSSGSLSLSVFLNERTAGKRMRTCQRHTNAS